MARHRRSRLRSPSWQNRRPAARKLLRITHKVARGRTRRCTTSKVLARTARHQRIRLHFTWRSCRGCRGRAVCRDCSDVASRSAVTAIAMRRSTCVFLYFEIGIRVTSMGQDSILTLFIRFPLLRSWSDHADIALSMSIHAHGPCMPCVPICTIRRPTPHSTPHSDLRRASHHRQHINTTRPHPHAAAQTPHYAPHRSEPHHAPSTPAQSTQLITPRPQTP